MATKGPRDGVFRALLRLFPSEFRGDFGDQMAADFKDQRDDAQHRHGVAGTARVWLNTVADLLWRAPHEHLDILRRDATHAIRVLRRRPASTATVVLSLAVGIGLNTALFSVVNGVLWRSLPFADSGRLVGIFEVATKSPDRTAALTQGDFADLREQTRAFSAVGAGEYLPQTIVEPGEPEQIATMRVTEGFFDTLGARPALGRTFNDADFAASSSVDLTHAAAIADRLNRHASGGALQSTSVVISHAFWQQRFLGRVDIVGQQVRLGSGVMAEIVGVMGSEMASVAPEYGVAAQMWLPQSPNRNGRQGQILDTFARLGPGQPMDAAQAELQVIGSNIARAFPASNEGRSFRAVPLLDTLVKNVRSELTFLFAAVLCVLLVTCVNVVHLSLASAAGRRVELATRVALGATRATLVRQTLTESALLALVGGAGGILLAAWAVPLLVAIAPPGIPRLSEVRVAWSAFVFAAGASFTVALLCGIAASLPLTMLEPWRSLVTARSGATLEGRRVRRALAVCEIAVALTLVVAAMLMVRTMRSFATLDLGFTPQGVVSTILPQPAESATDSTRLAGMKNAAEQAIDAVKQLPGVVAAGVGGSPMGLMMGVGGVTIPGVTRELPMVALQLVSAGYFEALGVRLKAGRFFTEDDRTGAPAVAVLGESAARTFWPGGSAVGQTLVLPGRPASTPVRVVGVVADLSEWNLVTRSGGIFLPYLQSSHIPPGSMLIRTTGDPQSLVPAIKSIVRRFNPEQPFPGVTPLQDEIDLATAPRRFILRLIGLFSILGLSLAVLGIYGVLAESVAERIPEIGVRMALGAQPSNVVAMILRQGAMLIGAGLVLGLIGALLLRHEMTTMVFGVGTVDPLSYAAACGVLTFSALVACAIPARKASKLDPVVALRME